VSEQEQTEKLAVGVAEAAAMIGLGRDLTYGLVMSGDILSFKVGARRLISVAALREFVERQTAEARGAQHENGAR
jgi:excisionase family DNA binding protein